MNKAAQSSLEYITTYGWALVLFIAVAAVIFFVLAPDSGEVRFKTDSTKFLVRSSDSDEGGFRVDIINATGRPITIDSINPGGFEITGPQLGEVVPSGGTITVIGSFPSGPTSGSFQINYSGDQTGTVNVIVNAPKKESCGDETCSESETCTTCPEDCGTCPPECGDGTCEENENCLADSQACTEPLKCYARTCVNGCGSELIAEGEQDNDGTMLCNEATGCIDPPCYCNGSGQCIPDPMPWELTACSQINYPGEFYLTGNLAADPGYRCISVLASQGSLTIDCQGHSITGSAGVSISSRMLDIVLKNCELIGTDGGSFPNGVAVTQFADSTSVSCEGTLIRGDGSGDSALRIDASGTTVSGCSIATSPGESAIFIQGRSNTVENSDVQGSVLLSMGANGNTIQNNSFGGGTLRIYNAHGNRILDNTWPGSYPNPPLGTIRLDGASSGNYIEGSEGLWYLLVMGTTSGNYFLDNGAIILVDLAGDNHQFIGNGPLGHVAEPSPVDIYGENLEIRDNIVIGNMGLSNVSNSIIENNEADHIHLYQSSSANIIRDNSVCNGLKEILIENLDGQDPASGNNTCDICTDASGTDYVCPCTPCP